MSGLTEVVADSLIRRMAGERSYGRGVDYFRDGHVEHLKETANGIRAVVVGTYLYDVKLTSTGKTLDYDCDCPYGSEGEFCKHCVAAALTWLARDKSVKPAKAGRGTKPKPPTMADGQRAMLALAHDELVRKVMEWAKDDDKLRGRILALAPESAGPNLAIETAARGRL